MKYYISIVFLISMYFNGFGQISLEHHYNEGMVKRIFLESYGEVYVVYNWGDCHQIDFYHSDHSYWKTLDLPLPTGSGINNEICVSQTLINPDDHIEIAFTYYYELPNGYQHSGGLIINDAGNVILNLPYADKIYVSEIQGLPKKLIINDHDSIPETRVYSLPGMQLEHIFNYGTERIFLNYSGEKYFYHDTALDHIALYNSDGSLWMNIPTPVYGDGIYGNYFVYQSAESPAVTVGYVYYTLVPPIWDREYTAVVVDEDAGIIITVPDGYRLSVSKLPGLPDKLIINNYWYDLGSEVYSLPEYNLEAVYPYHDLRRVKLNGASAAYLMLTPWTNKMEVFRDDHTFRKTLKLSDNDSSDQTTYLAYFGTNFINNDTLFEIGAVTSPDGGTLCNGRILNENGDVIMDLPGAQSISSSIMLNWPNKLFVNYHCQINACATEVYGLPTFGTPVEDVVPEINNLLFPNPTGGLVQIHLPEFRNTNVKLQIFNGIGKLQFTGEISGGKGQLDLSALSAGMYVIVIQGDGKVISQKLIRE